MPLAAAQIRSCKQNAYILFVCCIYRERMERMLIDRERLVRRHNPRLDAIDPSSPLTAGNGNFAITVDITGMQSLYGYYEREKFPLCTQSQWGWHTAPADTDKGFYTREELVETEYDFNGRTVRYPIECAPGNEAVYHWLRQNPHRLNLARIGLLLDGEELREQEIDGISQELDLYTGIITSSFRLRGVPCTVRTAVDPDTDTAGFELESELAEDGRLSVLIDFPYGSPAISASDFNRRDAHETILRREGAKIRFDRRLDEDEYVCVVSCGQAAAVREDANLRNRYALSLPGKKTCSFAFSFSGKYENGEEDLLPSAKEVFARSREGWLSFWKKTGVIELAGSTDPRAFELERRIVLSQYLLAIQSSGSLPPQETGLTCNSWYGKFHLEMYFWHEAYLPLYGRTDLMERSLGWFMEHLPEARANAAKNGYRGARWPKMVGPDALDSPSPIAPLLVWQQPHLLYMLYFCYRDTEDLEFVRRYYPIIRESADFMADFAVRDSEGYYELLSPLIPVQECHPPRETRNPVFEVEYWVVGLRIASFFASLLGAEVPGEWLEVARNMIPSPKGSDSTYLACSGCTETYGKYAVDHPSFLMAFGVIDSGRMDEKAMERSLEKSLEVWKEASLWGWDFAVMAMTAVKLHRPDFAIDLILRESLKNVYVESGNNRQVSRDDLPLYLPGNGSLLLAAAMMAAGYEGCDIPAPGFPKDGNWVVRTEGIHPLPAVGESLFCGGKPE